MIKVHILSTRKNCNGTVYLPCGEGEDADGRNGAFKGTTLDPQSAATFR